MSENKIKITPAKGRPMLNWIGKKPLEYVKGFPTQLIEVFNPLNNSKRIETPTYEELKDNWQNLLFYGDNKEVLATLLELGFRGKIDLIYIDPPFKSGADYVRKVELRGIKELGSLKNDEASVLQQTMYFDIWNNDNYLQFMYERLQLMKELLSETGSIYVHLDWHVGHYVKIIMDEIFGIENFRNEILTRRGQTKNLQYQFKHFKTMNVFNDYILWYSKNPDATFNPPLREALSYQRKGRWQSMWNNADRPTMRYELLGVKIDVGQWKWSKERALRAVENYKEYLRESQKTRESLEEYWIRTGKCLEFVWRFGKSKPVYWVPPQEEAICDNNWFDIKGYEYSEGFETQKSEDLLKRIILASSNPDNLVLDCFCGSGTTLAVAQKLGRRWIGCDINKGAIQLTSSRLQKIIKEQIEKNETKYPTFALYKVNNYDLKLLHTEAIELAVQHIGIQRTRTDTFFDGTLGKNLVKIIDFNHPLTLLDLQLLQDELKKRPDEDRDITIVCLGKELAVDAWIDEWNKKHPVNKIRVIELRTDKKYGNFLIHKPAEAKVEIKRKNNKVFIEIKDFISPTIIERLNIDNQLWKVKIADFRAMINYILIDKDYDGKVFNVFYSDVPQKKTDLIKGKYELEVNKDKTKIAVKIVDMLGEEVLITKDV